MIESIPGWLPFMIVKACLIAMIALLWRFGTEWQ